MGINNFDILKKHIDASDVVIVGAGAGLSTAAGFEYGGENFRAHFADFEDAFDFHDMYVGGFYPFPDAETLWAFWSRSIWLNRYSGIPGDTYDLLLDLVKDKDYFVLSSNVDHCFQQAGFDKNRLFYTQGDYGLFQCSLPCTQETYDNYDIVKAMCEQQKDMRIPSELVPRCPHCGRPMEMNLRCDLRFAEDAGWHKAAANYESFLISHGVKHKCFFDDDFDEIEMPSNNSQATDVLPVSGAEKHAEGAALNSAKEQHIYDGHILFLELGVGLNTPGIVKIPFQQMTYENENAEYVVINPEGTHFYAPIKDRTTILDCDINDALTPQS